MCACICVLETCFLGLLFLNLSFVPLPSPGTWAVAAPALPSSPDSLVRRLRCPCNKMTVKGSSPLVKLTLSPACKAAPTCVMQGHQTASSLSAWLLLSPSLCFCLSPFPSLSPSLLFLSLSVLHWHSSSPSQSHQPHQVFIQKNTLYLAQRPDYAHTEREGATDGGWGRERAERDPERVCSDRHTAWMWITVGYSLRYIHAETFVSMHTTNRGLNVLRVSTPKLF